MIQVVYTNSNCNDVFVPFLKQNKKHCNLPLYTISDYDLNGEGIVDSYKYGNDEPYYKVWADALTNFNSEYFIYLQEDFFLFDAVKEDVLEKYRDFLANSKYSFVRLLKSGKLGNKAVADNLYEIEPMNENIFSMQATIWKTEDYIKLMNTVKSPGWLETDADYRYNMIAMGMYGLYHFNDEKQIGTHHWDSSVYPYIATAVVKGKWNYKEYANVLNEILEENNIDSNIRGKL